MLSKHLLFNDVIESDGRVAKKLTTLGFALIIVSALIAGPILYSAAGWAIAVLR